MTQPALFNDTPVNVPEDDFGDIVAMWNSHSNLPQVRNLSPGRQRKLNARLHDKYWVANVREAITRISNSSFCTGRNGRGWKADFDWLLQPDVVAKVMEGKYDDRKSGGTHGVTQVPGVF